MKEMLIPLLVQYGYVLAAGFVAALAVAMVYAIPLVYQIFQYLKTLAEKNMSEKVSMRIKDALDKLYGVVKVLIEAESSLIRTEILKAIADGKIDEGEVKAIREAIAKKAMEIITPEIETIKRYLTGQAIMDYVVAVTTSMLIKRVQGMVDKNGQLQNPFGTASSTTTTPQ